MQQIIFFIFLRYAYREFNFRKESGKKSLGSFAVLYSYFGFAGSPVVRKFLFLFKSSFFSFFRQTIGLKEKNRSFFYSLHNSTQKYTKMVSVGLVLKKL